MIILATINAKYIHASFGLRYLKANLKEFEEKAEILEFSKDDNLYDIVEKILAKSPDFVGFACYIWNIEDILKLCDIIRALAPEIKIILGGPEVSYENADFLPYCDWLIEGEGELALYEVVKNQPPEKIIKMPICDLSQLKLPYYLYNEDDIKNRIIYVESSRGCPFGCEFCLSSLSKGVREFELGLFLENMKMLLDKGVWHFKFVDRTFNLKFERCKKILDFFRSNWVDGMKLHFEVFPDKLSSELLAEIKTFPAGGLHLEAGVQSFFEPSLSAISRKQNEIKTLENLEFIMQKTGADIHADLVAGLPDSTIKTFGQDFDKIMKLKPQELQIGILKKLRGAPIGRHTEYFKMIYSKIPPYEVLQTKDITFTQMQQIKRFARYFDIFYNSRNFDVYWNFATWLEFSNFIWTNYHQTHKISKIRQQQILERFINEENPLSFL